MIERPVTSGRVNVVIGTVMLSAGPLQFVHQANKGRNAVVTRERKLFQNYFRGLLQLINIFQHSQRR